MLSQLRRSDFCLKSPNDLKRLQMTHRDLETNLLPILSLGHVCNMYYMVFWMLSQLQGSAEQMESPNDLK